MILLTDQEWEKLSPESRHKLNILVQKVESFVRAIFGSNHDLANVVLAEMGFAPNTACTPTGGDSAASPVSSAPENIPVNQGETTPPAVG